MKLKCNQIEKALVLVSIWTGLLYPQTIINRWSTFDMGAGVSASANTVSASAIGQLLVGELRGATVRLGSGILSDTLVSGPLTAVEDIDATLPLTFALRQNYPNPFNPSTTITYELPKRSNVIVAVFNILGQLVTTLVSEEENAGRYSILWNGRTNAGLQASSGVYFYRIQAQSVEVVTDFTDTKKLILLR